MRVSAAIKKGVILGLVLLASRVGLVEAQNPPFGGAGGPPVTIPTITPPSVPAPNITLPQIPTPSIPISPITPPAIPIPTIPNITLPNLDPGAVLGNPPFGGVGAIPTPSVPGITIPGVGFKPDPRFVGKDVETYEDAKKTMDKLQQQLNSGSNVGTEINQQFGLHGSKRAGDGYKKHDWFNGNQGWDADWISDSGKIASKFFSCLSFSIKGFCKKLPPKIRIEFWWPEVQLETNNYAIGSWLVGQYRDEFIRTKEFLLPQALTELKTKSGEKAQFPSGLRNNPNIGQSHTDDTGNLNSERTRMYESHVYRTYFDTLISILPMVPQCIKKLIPPPPNKRFAVNWSEYVLAPFWRVPELSYTRTFPATTPGKYIQLFGSSPFVGTLAGTEYHRTSMSPLLAHVPPKYNNVLNIGTCASLRASDWNRFKNPINFVMDQRILPVGSEELRKICYHHSVGQLYPLTGDIEANAETTAVVGAMRRMMEWSSWEFWNSASLGFDMRTNYFNDFDGNNLFRKKNGSLDSGNRKPDKWQRVYPEPTGCFKMDDVDERNRSRFPIGMLNPSQKGSQRYVHWNRRRACVSLFAVPELLIQLPKLATLVANIASGAGLPGGDALSLGGSCELEEE